MRLGTRLLLPLLAAALMIMSGYALWALAQRERTLSEQAVRETHAYATAFGLALEYALRDQRIQEAQELIDRLSREREIYGLVVYDRRKTPIFASELMRGLRRAPAAHLERVLATGAPVEFTRSVGDERLFSVLRPVHSPGDTVVAAFEVAQPLSFVEAEKARTRHRFVLNTLTLLAALTVLILLMVHSMVERPLKRFVAAARALGRGELAHRITEDPGATELRQLAAEFNRMAGSLGAARAELVRESEERIALERRLREAEKMAAVGNLAAGLAHEIGTPLNVIAGRAEMLLKRDPGPEARARSLGIVVDQIRRITTIVRNLLDFARRREPSLQRIDLAEVLDSVLEFLDGELTRAGVRLERSGPRPLWIQGDAHLLHQVFINLLVNAVQAVEPLDAHARRIRVRTVETESGRGAARVAVEIEDTGLGIPEDRLARIFEPFFTTKTGGQGTGLGLAVSRSIVEEHGGAMEAENRAGGGAVFRVSVPAARPAEVVHA